MICETRCTKPAHTHAVQLVLFPAEREYFLVYAATIKNTISHKSTLTDSKQAALRL